MLRNSGSMVQFVLKTICKSEISNAGNRANIYYTEFPL